MGACFSQSYQQSKLRSEEIDRSLDEDNWRLKRECKVLLLGLSGSGKSTIVEQMKIIQGGFTKYQLQEYTPIIYRNVLECARSVVIYMRKTGIDCKESHNRVLMEKILDYNPVPNGPSEVQFTLEIAEAIHQFLKDPVVPEVVEDHMSKFYSVDSAEYIFNNFPRIGAAGYVPSELDVLRACRKSVGITETHVTLGQLSIRMLDVSGQHTERRKWIHCFESVTSIIFCTALSDYDQDLVYTSRNRMRESLVLFESVINSRWFIGTSIILLLNKVDVFKRKLPKVPLARFFEEYTGGSDVNKAAKYILWKFMQANRARLSVYPHITQATDTTNIRLVFAAIKETILQNALKHRGIL